MSLNTWLLLNIWKITWYY